MQPGPINNDYHLVTSEGQEGPAFQEWIVTNSKSYSTADEMEERLKNFKENNKTIREHNKAAAESGVAHPVMYNHNPFSDTSLEEREKRKGVGL